MDRDLNDNVYVVGNYRDSLVLNDSTKFSSNTARPSGYGYFDAYLAKTSPDGQVLWGKRIYLNDSVFSDILTLNLSNITVSKNGIITLFGFVHYSRLTSTRSVVKFGDNDSLNFYDCGIRGGAKFANFLASFDTAGNFLNATYISCGGLDPAQSNNANLLSNDTAGNPILLIYYRNTNTAASTFYVGFKPYSINTGLQLIKYSKSLDTILFARNLVREFAVPSRVRVGEDNQIYAALNLMIDSVYDINGVRYNLKQNVPATTNNSNRVSKGFFFVCNQNGSIFHQGLINSRLETFDFVADIYGRDTQNIYVVGYVKDTLSRNNKIFASNIPGATNSTSLSFPYIAKISLRDIEWSQITLDNLSSFQLTNVPTLSYNTKLAIDKKGYAYVALDYNQRPLHWGGLIDTSASASITRAFVKMDSIGNALWIQRFATSVGNMKPNSLEELAYCGSSGRRTFTPFTLENSFNRNLSYGYVAQLEDLNIVRGEVFKGPYCAGDSILVPFKTAGTYNSSNFFVAEISDENGEFIGKERELGRIGGTDDSVVTGVLPLFQIASSANYRIRIRSTSPAVQSFYQLDTLRLLIFSRDKADPGPPAWACLGRPFSLETFSETKWTWSPAFNMDDSTLRTPTIIPEKDTVYQIIIADSSGCGEADTSFKQIFIRDFPKISTLQDTIFVCQGIDTLLHAQFTGGDSSAYRWKWFAVNENIPWTLIKQDSGSLLGSLLYRLPDSVLNRQKIALVLDDKCNLNQDTQFFLIQLNNTPTSVDFIQEDPILCFQKPQKLNAQISGGGSGVYEWNWFVFVNNTPVNFKNGSNGTFDSIRLTFPPGNTFSNRIMFVSRDLCTPFSDTFVYVMYIDQSQPKIQFLPSDTAVCPNSSIPLSPLISGTSDRGFAWKIQDPQGNILQNGDQSNANPILLSSASLPAQYQLIATDNCSPFQDSFSFQLSSLPPLQTFVLNESDTTTWVENELIVCDQSELRVMASAQGGNPLSYSYQWILDGKSVDASNSFHLKPSFSSSPYLLQLVLSDNCLLQNDTTQVQIKVKPPLRVTLSASGSAQEEVDSLSLRNIKACFGSQLSFKALASGGDSNQYSYEWWVNDSIRSQTKDFAFSPGRDTLWVVKLLLHDGCSPADTSVANITVLQPLQVVFAAPDTVCNGQELVVSAQASGGLESNYQFKWLLDGQILSNSDQLTFTFPDANNGKSALSVLLTDGCSAPQDSFTQHFTLLTPLSV